MSETIDDTVIEGSAPEYGAMRWARFADAELEQEYRRSIASADRGSVLIGMRIIPFLVLAFAPTDYALYGPTAAFWGLLALRLVLVVFCVGIIGSYRRGTWRDWRDELLLGWALYAIFAMGVVGYTRPADYHLDITVSICMSLLYFLFLPNRFVYQAATACLYSVVMVSVYLGVKEGLTGMGALAVVIAFVIVAVAGGTAAWGSHHRRRRLFLVDKRLREALANIKTLSGLIPICGHCKSVRNDSGYWEGLEEYIALHSEAEFSHSLCPDCYDEELRKAGVSPTADSRESARRN